GIPGEDADGGSQPTIDELRRQAGGWLDSYGRYHLPGGGIDDALSDAGSMANGSDIDDEEDY
ncbi:MAG: hypothetical protein LBJ10_09660, partial [Clostridiales bacterium]|nr:hypothetical protein [Clostridiales bacterium]